MTGWYGWIGIIALIAIMLLWPRKPERPPVTRLHRGLEMKARGGRLVYIRQTESEREV